MLRRRTKHDMNSNRRQSMAPCVAMEIFAQYQDNRRVDEPPGCELQGEDLNGRQYRIRIKGLKSSWARRNNVTSGAHAVFVPDGALHDDHMSELVITSGATIKYVLHHGVPDTLDIRSLVTTKRIERSVVVQNATNIRWTPVTNIGVEWSLMHTSVFCMAAW